MEEISDTETVLGLWPSPREAVPGILAWAAGRAGPQLTLVALTNTNTYVPLVYIRTRLPE